MRPTRFRLTALILLAALSSAALAATEKHMQYAEKLLELTHADRLAVPVYAQVQQMFADRFVEAKASANKQALLESYQAKANATLDTAIGWGQLKSSLIKLYTEEFNEPELKQMVDFYQSDLGRKMLAKLPKLNHASAQMAQTRLEQVAPEVNKLLDEMTADLTGKKK